MLFWNISQIVELLLQDLWASTTQRALKRPSRPWMGSRSGWSASKCSLSAPRTRIGRIRVPTRPHPPQQVNKRHITVALFCVILGEPFWEYFLSVFLCLVLGKLHIFLENDYCYVDKRPAIAWLQCLFSKSYYYIIRRNSMDGLYREEPANIHFK